MIQDWARWIFASATKHFKEAADANNVMLFIEGIDRETNEVSKWWEFRMDGPQTTHLNIRYYTLDVEINMLWSVDMNSSDFHEQQRQIGILTGAMTDICVYRYGDGPNDDQSFLGTLTLVQNGAIPVRVVQFGQTKPDTKIFQGTVEGSFRMELTL